MKIGFLIRSLGTGGAERQLVTLAVGLHERGHDVTVACLYDIEGPHKTTLEEAGVHYHTFGKKGRWEVWGFFWRLRSFVCALAPDILHSYMPLQNILALLLKPFLPRKTKVVCGVRSAMPTCVSSSYDHLTCVTYWLERKILRAADGVISNSQAAKALYPGLWDSPAPAFLIIPNGVDCAAFRLDPSGGQAFRQAHNLPEEACLVGVVGRFDISKDYPTLLKIAHQSLQERPDLFFVCIGDKTGPDYTALVTLAEDLGLTSRLRWLDKQSDMTAVYNALDLLCLPSRFEGFPNVLVEALACGTPCLSSDVGDANLILTTQELGTVVPREDLVADFVSALRIFDPKASAQKATFRRQEVQARFSVEALVTKTEQALRGFQEGKNG